MKKFPEDPREFRYIELRYLLIDKRAQREVRDERAERMANEWDWVISEVLTVTPDPETIGQYLVIEGQNRCTALMKCALPDQPVPCMVISAETVAERSRVARAIALGRRGHSAVARWKIAVKSKVPHEEAANRELEALGLRVGESPSMTTIYAAAALSRLIRVGRRTPADGAELLYKTLTVLIGAFPDQQEAGRQGRFDAVLIDAVGMLIVANPNVDMQRLITTMGSRRIRQWIAEAEGASTPRWRSLGQAVASRYNRNLRNPGRKVEF